MPPPAQEQKRGIALLVLGLIPLLCVICALVAAFLAETFLGIRDSIYPSIVGGGIGVLLTRRHIRKLGARYKEPDFTLEPRVAITAAKRPPVLFLRSFGLDDLSQLPQGPWVTPLTPSEEQNFVTVFTGAGPFLERRSAVPENFRPMLAIGRPGEREPLLGATRFYVRHDKWQRIVEELVPLCSLIVWGTGHTQGLRWEIGHLVQTVAPERLLLWVHVNVSGSTPHWRASEWARVLAMCGGVFPKFLPRDVENVDVIAFGSDWTPQSIPLGRWDDRHAPLRNFLKSRNFLG